ncbi:putative salK [Mycobacterium xenopi 4042]|uniref:Putative salK n=1 Tax=Mycobacterium xenopi 4042 TaxID=1299334 RepID=X7YK58_MYCXE|nr:putative salK [Mycobacterium xenopi 4042]
MRSPTSRPRRGQRSTDSGIEDSGWATSPLDRLRWARAPQVVTAVFYNFAPWRVAKALPAAWEIADPQLALRARETSAVAALRRYGVTDDENVRTAAQLAAKAVQHAPVDGRPLFAANLALPWPAEPLAALWHATTLLREHRGDGHVAVLAAAGSPAGSPMWCMRRPVRYPGITLRAPVITTTPSGAVAKTAWPRVACSLPTGR